jgi:hypothetical protein
MEALDFSNCVVMKELMLVAVLQMIMRRSMDSVQA